MWNEARAANTPKQRLDIFPPISLSLLPIPLIKTDKRQTISISRHVSIS